MKRLKRWLYIALPLVLVLVAVVVLLGKWSSGPSEGTVRTLSPKTSSEPTVVLEPLTLQNSLFSTTLPAGFVLKDMTKPNSPETAVRILAYAIKNRQQVGITAGTMPVGGISELGDYHLRVTDTAAYRRSTNTTLPAGSAAFEDSVNSMVTLFWSHGNNYAEITVSGDPGSSTLLYSLLSNIQQVWQWK